MPTYYIDTNDGSVLDRDEEGITLDGPAEAKALAESTLSDMLRELGTKPRRTEFEVTVRTDEGDLGKVSAVISSYWPEERGTDPALSAAMRAVDRQRR